MHRGNFYGGEVDGDVAGVNGWRRWQEVAASRSAIMRFAPAKSFLILVGSSVRVRDLRV